MAKEKYIRSCFVTKQKKPKHELLRFVVVDGFLIWDPKQILPGRGGYVLDEKDVILKLPKMKKKIQHFLKCKNFEIKENPREF